MKIGIVVPSIYATDDIFRKRIIAPVELAILFANGLKKAGHDVLFFSGPGLPINSDIVTADEDLLKNNFDMDYAQDIPPDAVSALSKYEKKKYFELGIVKKAFELAKAKKIDLLHVYFVVGGISHYFTELLDIPTIYTIHGAVPPSGSIERWRYGRFFYQNFVSVSGNQKSQYQKAIPRINFVGTVLNGVDTEEFSFGKGGEGYFASMGRMVPEKGNDIAIKIAIESKINLQIVTYIDSIIEKSEYYLKHIFPYINNTNITMRGHINGEERLSFFKNAKALLFLIQWDEPFGMVMIEAMSCGTPVIAYNRGAVSEVVKDGVTGFIVDPDDEDRPGKGTWIIKEKGIRGLKEAVKRIGEIDRRKCREHVEQNFTVEKMVGGYEKVYQKVISR